MSDLNVNGQAFINEFKDFCDKQLNNELDLFKLIGTIFEIDKFQLIEDLAFASKYCLGLLNILQHKNAEVKAEYWQDITQNLSESIETLKAKLREVIEHYNEFDRKSFESRYFELNQASLNRLLSLIEDFAEVKLFLNAKKRQA